MINQTKLNQTSILLVHSDLAEYEYSVPSYGTRTIGCPFDRAISVVSAQYGNLADKCFIDGKAFVEKACSGSMCRGVRATKSFFNGTEPCPKKRYARKTITIKYKCPDISKKFNYI